MSVDLQQQVEQLEQRISQLEKYIDSQVTPRFDDVQDDHKSLSVRINEYQGRLEKQLSDTNATLSAELYKLLAELREKFYERVQQEIAKVTSDEIAKSLAKTVLKVRQATRDELNNPDTLKVRQATLAEIQNR